MGGGFLAVDFARTVVWVWAGWGSALAEGLGGRPCLVGLFSRVVGLSGDWCRRHACHASASCLCGECGVVGAPACVGVACCRGSGAVRPGCLTRVLLLVCGWLGLGVGGLVVNCIVDASILL